MTVCFQLQLPVPGTLCRLSTATEDSTIPDILRQVAQLTTVMFQLPTTPLGYSPSPSSVLCWPTMINRRRVDVKPTLFRRRDIVRWTDGRPIICRRDTDVPPIIVRSRADNLIVVGPSSGPQRLVNWVGLNNGRVLKLRSRCFAVLLCRSFMIKRTAQ